MANVEPSEDIKCIVVYAGNQDLGNFLDGRLPPQDYLVIRSCTGDDVLHDMQDGVDLLIFDAAAQPQDPQGVYDQVTASQPSLDVAIRYQGQQPTDWGDREVAFVKGPNNAVLRYIKAHFEPSE